MVRLFYGVAAGNRAADTVFTGPFVSDEHNGVTRDNAGNVRPQHERYETQAQAMREITEYIEIFYNRQRRHSKLGYLGSCRVRTEISTTGSSRMEMASTLDDRPHALPQSALIPLRLTTAATAIPNTTPRHAPCLAN